jgi:hypothetical protein
MFCVFKDRCCTLPIWNPLYKMGVPTDIPELELKREE